MGGGGLNLEGLRYRSVSLVVCRRYLTHRVESHFHAVPHSSLSTAVANLCLSRAVAKINF